VLLLASGAFSSNPSTKPATTKPMMSDPARPEMAQGAIKALPADYAQAEAEIRRLAEKDELGPRTLAALVQEWAVRFALFAVDDGRRDGSAALLQRLCRHWPGWRPSEDCGPH
jgi:hypothetical protein